LEANVNMKIALYQQKCEHGDVAGLRRRNPS
jgi:hypothetical protein